MQAVSEISDRPWPASSLDRWLNVYTLAIIVWFEYAVGLLAPVLWGNKAIEMTADDAVRLVEVRDLLRGQDWFDLSQYRMNPPQGIAMHWSRIVDAPLAALTLLFERFFSYGTAEHIAIAVWPVLLMLLAWLAIARIALVLAGREAGAIALLFALSAMHTLGYFRPGEIDHHNFQMVLTLWSIALLLEFETSSLKACGCAALCCVSLGVGLETIGYVALVCAIVATHWVVRGKAVAGQVRYFGATFSAISFLLLFTFAASRERYIADCLTYSGIYALLAISGGLGLCLATLPNFKDSVLVRGGTMVALGLGLFVLLLALAPECSAGPYNWVTPELNRVWLSRIDEAQSPFTTPRGAGFIFSAYIYPLVGIAASLLAAFMIARPKRHAMLSVSAFAVLAGVVATFQMRGIPFAVLLGLPGLAISIRILAERMVQPGLYRSLASLLAVLLLNNLSFSIVGYHFLEGDAVAAQRMAAQSVPLECMGSAAVSGLSALPVGVVATFFDVAPTVLVNTEHSVLSGSYRDPEGIMDTYRLFTGSPRTASAILKRHLAKYVVICNASPDYFYYSEQGGKGSFIGLLRAGHIPTWLQAMPPSGPHGIIRIFRVLPDRMPS